MVYCPGGMRNTSLWRLGPCKTRVVVTVGSTRTNALKRPWPNWQEAVAACRDAVQVRILQGAPPSWRQAQCTPSRHPFLSAWLDPVGSPGDRSHYDLRHLAPHRSTRSCTTRRRTAPDHQTMSDLGPAYEFLPTKDGLVCFVRHAPSSWIVRLMPWRDPDQPRFWCLRMELSTGANLAAPTSELDPFYSCLAMSRQELLDTLVRIQADAETWFGEPAQADVRLWLADAVQVPKPPPAARTWSSLRPRPARTPTQ